MILGVIGSFDQFLTIDKYGTQVEKITSWQWKLKFVDENLIVAVFLIKCTSTLLGFIQGLDREKPFIYHV